MTAAQSVAISADRQSPAGIVIFEGDVESSVLGPDNFIDGYVRKLGNTAFKFPVGDNGMLRPFVATANNVDGAYYGVDPSVAVTSNPQGGNYGVLPLGGPFSTGMLGAGVALVSRREYWDINGAEPTKITLTWNAASDVATLTRRKGLSKLGIAGWDGSRWTKINAVIDVNSIFGSASNETMGSITTQAALVPSTYNVYTLVGLADDALPVTLVNFTAVRTETSVQLEWRTSAEVNASHFEVEHSPDGKNWGVLGKITANAGPDVNAGNPMHYLFLDSQPLEGTNLYRLKMVDKDETFAYSSIRAVDFGDRHQLVAYPNPAIDRVFVKGLGNRKLKQATLIHSDGRPVQWVTNTLRQDGMDVRNIAEGIYVLHVSYEDGTGQSVKVLVRK